MHSYGFEYVRVRAVPASIACTWTCTCFSWEPFCRLLKGWTEPEYDLIMRSKCEHFFNTNAKLGSYFVYLHPSTLACCKIIIQVTGLSIKQLLLRAQERQATALLDKYPPSSSGALFESLPSRNTYMIRQTDCIVQKGCLQKRIPG